MHDLRKIEVLVDGKWEHINLCELKSGDTFRMFESTGEPVVDEKGRKVWIVTSDIFIKDGMLAINIK